MLFIIIKINFTADVNLFEDLKIIFLPERTHFRCCDFYVCIVLVLVLVLPSLDRALPLSVSPVSCRLASYMMMRFCCRGAVHFWTVQQQGDDSLGKRPKGGGGAGTVFQPFFRECVFAVRLHARTLLFLAIFALCMMFRFSLVDVLSLRFFFRFILLLSTLRKWRGVGEAFPPLNGGKFCWWWTIFRWQLRINMVYGSWECANLEILWHFLGDILRKAQRSNFY